MESKRNDLEATTLTNLSQVFVFYGNSHMALLQLHSWRGGTQLPQSWLSHSQLSQLEQICLEKQPATLWVKKWLTSLCKSLWWHQNSTAIISRLGVGVAGHLVDPGQFAAQLHSWSTWDYPPLLLLHLMRWTCANLKDITWVFSHSGSIINYSSPRCIILLWLIFIFIITCDLCVAHRRSSAFHQPDQVPMCWLET